MLLPLNDLQGEIRGLVGRNILKQQLQTGDIDVPSISRSLKDTGAVNIGLAEDETNLAEESRNRGGEVNRHTSDGNEKQSSCSKDSSVLPDDFALVSINFAKLPSETSDTAL